MKNQKTPFDQKRRSFLKLSGLLGLGAASAALLPAESAEAFLFNKKEYKVTKTRLAMGTFVAMTAIHSSQDEAEQAIGLAFEEIDRLNAMLTHYEKTSAVGSFNASGKLEHAPVEVVELIGRSLYYNRETQGAFDITVKPLIDLYKNSFAVDHKPSDSEIDLVLKRVGTENMRYDAGSIVFTKSDMGITLDGIAKGFIVDKASEVLKANGVSNHLINAGGDIRTSGKAAQGKAWTVAVQDPSKKNEYPDIITMQDGAIATSGNYEIYYDKEKLFHHIVNGQTGHSPHLSSSVSVVAPTVMDADALATSVFVMGPAAGVAFINGQPDTECFIIDKDGKNIKSAGWQV
ncbi:FAD:protein FMN transferase [Desulforhopalus sp. IMCC35007]|uniref:FAD:protein FMN transferase n=1 Tax=Desulforhopalus sp. IMCC35007 TaxID=2569543 RepID=UPI0010AE1F06|nr:FAD:protein FMN transferase [Desulforhopalus sp. IMCC35007]TKB09967.1 FAD:protein FMN transferase [Desulforhopalus sp. IMCC35007]